VTKALSEVLQRVSDAERVYRDTLAQLDPRASQVHERQGELAETDTSQWTQEQVIAELAKQTAGVSMDQGAALAAACRAKSRLRRARRQAAVSLRRIDTPDVARTTVPQTRARGAGRPPARATRSSAASGDSGEDDPEPPPRLCKCGRCGVDLSPLISKGLLRANALYLNPTHRKRGQRARDADPEISVQRGLYDGPRFCRCNSNGNGRPLPEFDPDLGCWRCVKDGHRLPGEIYAPPRPVVVRSSPGYVTASSPSRKWRDRPSRGEPRRPVTYRSLHDTPPPKGGDDRG
jgi:hypothetical protein